MKKTICMLLAAVLAMSLMAGCAEQDFWVDLHPLDADLDWSPNVIVEPEEPPYNLGQWPFDSSVSWDVELPRDGLYSLRFHYSMPGDYEPCTGYVSYVTEDGEEESQLLEFSPTSAPGSWDTYDWLETTMELPKGEGVLTVMPWEMPEDQEYFLNLRLIQVYSGEYPGDPDFYYQDSDDQPDVDPDDGEIDVNGWWVRPEGGIREGLSLVDIFYVDMDQGVWTSYNVYGEVADSYKCYLIGDTFSMEFGMLGASQFLPDGDQLCNPDDGQVEFVRVEDPGFKGQDLNFDGTWYFCGDENASVQMILEGKQFQKVRIGEDGPMVESEGTFTKNDVMHNANGQSFGVWLQLGFGDFHDVMPSADGRMLFEEEGFEHSLYVHESALDPALVSSLTTVNDMMNMDLYAHPTEETMLMLKLEPFGFYVVPYESDGDVGYSPTGEPGPMGQWSVPEPGILRLEYQDGTLEDVVLPEPEGLLKVESLNAEFQLQPVF